MSETEPQPRRCGWCGRPKGFYGPPGFCCFKCAVDAKAAAAVADREDSRAF